MIAIIDYQSGNLASVTNALTKIGAKFFITSDPKKIVKADKIIFPGVGHATQAMEALKKLNLIDILKKWDKPFLGICLGMQLMCANSEEGNTQCLEIINEKVKQFSIRRNKALPCSYKIPHMGWNKVKVAKDNPLFNGIKDDEHFYFVHSYFVPSGKYTIGQTNYIASFTAAIQHKNFYGVQFHPEKSGSVGLKVIQNFVNI